MEHQKTGFSKYLSRLDVWALSLSCIIGWGAFVMPGTTFLPVAGPAGTAVAMIAICILAIYCKPSIPIVAMTANAFKEDEEAAANAGMQGHIAKPIDVEKMQKTLSRVLQDYHHSIPEKRLSGS